MPFISVSNVRVEEAVVERDDGEFCIVTLLPSGSRIMVRKSRLYPDRKELEQKLGLAPAAIANRSPWSTIH